MDGTPAGFYFDPATNESDSSKWVLWLEGGGECTTAEECSGKPLGLRSTTNASTDIDPYHFASADPAESPGTFSWNRVFLKYCSQDLWSGTRQQASNETFGLYFSGHIIVQEVVSYLKATANLSFASHVVVGGDSAGGIGTWLNVGWVHAALPNAKVVGAPIAGFYAFSFPYEGPNASKILGLSDFSEEAWPKHVQLWQSHVDEHCARALGDRAWACMLSNYSRPYIQVPVFVSEAQTDLVQITKHDDIPDSGWNTDIWAYLHAWAGNMTQGLEALLPGDGLFNPACFIHTEFSKDFPLVNNSNGQALHYGQAFALWLDGHDVRLVDDCGLFCGACPTPKRPLEPEPVEPEPEFGQSIV